MVTWYWSAWFDRCQLIITCHVKKVHRNPEQHVSINLLSGVWPPRCATRRHHRRRRRRAYAPTRNTAGHENTRKSIHGFPLLPYMGMGLRLAALRAAGAPLLNCSCNRPRSIYQYSNMAPRLSGQNCKFFKFLLSLNPNTKKTRPNLQVWPESLGAMLEYWYIERGLFKAGIHVNRSEIWSNI